MSAGSTEFPAEIAPPGHTVIHVSAAIIERECILLVQESKRDVHGKWNLPGGHLEFGENIRDGVLREVREETGLTVRLTALIGVYTGGRPPVSHAVRFVLRANRLSGEPTPADDILDTRWFNWAELEALADDDLAGGSRLREIIADARVCNYPLSLLNEPGHGREG